ncbi:MAG: cyclomaltodextrinase / maltogenic alpha-amylase / neopullulanase [Chloroflexota bacterium]|nr:cyclomaltodextrinase / maltogenic alpha-amylase / neopullulanase [Chloroflexota bacterium]
MTNLSDTPAWVADAVFYQIFPDRFAPSARVPKPGPLEPWDAPPTYNGYKGGDLLGVVEHLDHLSELGITALYLTPVFASASNHRYHTYDYYQVDPLLGGNDALRELLDECHARGIRVILDGVFNHSGRGFWPFHHVVENGIGSPYLDWFHVDKAALAAGRELRPYPSREDNKRMAELAAAGTHQGDVSLKALGYRAWWDLPALPKLNTDNPGMREHLMGAAEHWLKFGIDGWRLDVAEEIDAGYWREFRKRCRAVNPDAYIVAEIWREKPYWVSGDTFDALMNYPLTEALLSFTGGRHLDAEAVQTQHEYRETVHPIDGPAFANRLQHLMTMYRPEAIRAQLNLLGSHDTARYLTLVSRDTAALRLALLATMTLPGAPCIYYGDEVGMQGRHDPDNRRAFPWDHATWDHELLEYCRAVIALRHNQPALRHGEFRMLAANGAVVAYGRLAGDSGALVLLNAGDAPARLTVPTDGFAGAELQPIKLASEPYPVLVGGADGRIEVEVAARSGAVLLAGGSGQ